ncbi:hypothetical protein FI667_g12664, partial [Globisporangium splendens]
MLGVSQAHKALVALFALNAYAYGAHATTVTIKNSCSESIQLWDNAVVQTMSPGATATRDLPIGFHGMFRAGVNPQATLAEFAVEGGFLWYDISIIPTGPKSGPEYCPSLQACKDLTGGVGYNMPMQIAPSGCQTVTCMSDGCVDAYQYPKDDTKTHACPMSNPVTVTFCPGGSGGSQSSTPTPTTQAPTPQPTTQAPTPVPTTQAPTPEPKTQAPTPEPTTQAPTPEPTTQAPTPEPTTQAPTPEPTTEAPTPEPTTEAPTPEPTPEPTASDDVLAMLGIDRSMDALSSGSGDAEVQGSSSSSTDDDAFRSADVGSGSVGSGSVGSGSVGSSVGSGSTVSADSSYAGFDTVGSEASAGSDNDQSLEAGALTPAPAAEFGSSTLNSVRQAGDSASGGTNVSAQTAETSSSKVSGTLLTVLAGVACVAGVAVFVTAKKKKALEQETVECKDSVLSVLPGDAEAMLTPIDNIQCI